MTNGINKFAYGQDFVFRVMKVPDNIKTEINFEENNGND